MLKKQTKGILIITGFIVLGFLLLWIIGKINEKQNDLIEKNGIETLGTVIEKSYGADDTGRQYSIKFDFYAGDKLTVGYLGLGNNKHYFDKAIIGMKYKVKYLADHPEKFKNSKIYIDTPDLEEFQNLENERIRIRKDYKNGEKFLKNARPIEEERKILGL